MTKNHSFDELALEAHEKLRGKIEVVAKTPVRTAEDLSLYYTPGVGAVSRLLGEKPELAKAYTIKSNTVAVVSDGSAVLGLGNIGPEGALPVMEGKAMLFKELAGVDAFPIVLDTQDEQEIIDTVARIAPAFGGINLEDIAAPKCFAIERALQEQLSIPVVHDDQHATAIVVLAGLMNATKVVNKESSKLRVVISGAGAAGSGVARLIHAWGVADIVVTDSRGIVSAAREDLNDEKRQLLEVTNQQGLSGSVDDALEGADVFLGLSQPNVISAEDVARMAPNPIVFAMANPQPEILPEDALRGGAAVVATGRSDYPNQINNVLVFPGLFKGLIRSGVTHVSDGMKLAAAAALAAVIESPTAEQIIPSVFDKTVVDAIARAVEEVK